MSAGLPPLLVITDRHQARVPLEEIGAAVIAAGAPWLLFRDKDLDRLRRRRIAEGLVAAARAAGARLSVGGDVDLARLVGADGVHVATLNDVVDARTRLGPGALVGFSAHAVDELGPARTAGADYATLSPIFPSASKPGYGPALGLAALAAAVPAGLPVYALGGVGAANAAACLGAGAAGVAVMGEVMRAADPAQRVRDVLRALEKAAGAG
ncbi:MAG TPA: thiamine phosphate synthase [Hyphomicrobiales bacterium]|nr:thiamine phosphate synthase [Hyphomicrobiales bacterium]